MRLGLGILCAGLLMAPLPTAQAAEPDAAGFVRITPSQLKWVDIPGGHGAKFAAVLGNQGGTGMYVVRVHFPAHVMDTPHFHPNDRYVTVLEGTWYAGTGPVFDPSKAVPMGPGGVMFHPGGGVHWDGSAGDDGATVQIIGMGPGATTPVDPQVANWVDVKR